MVQPIQAKSYEKRYGGIFNKYKRTLPRPLQGDVRDTTENCPPPQCVDNQAYTNRGIWWDIAPDEEYFKELFRVSKHQIIWGGNYFNLPPTRCFLIWNKKIPEDFSMAMAEYAWTSFNANAKIFSKVAQGTQKGPRFHPTQKPIDLYRWIFANYAKKGDKILDTHLGSGSSACAAHELGIDFTGIEIDEIYFNQACERLKRFATNNQPLLNFDL